MGHDDRREIFERLEALERLVRSHSEGHDDCDDHRHSRDRDRRDHGRHERGRHDRHHGRHDHHDRDRHEHRGRGRGDGDFQEKRIIDTIVQLVGERIERFIQDQQAKQQRRDDGEDEKRMVDLVVRLVGDRVREIVQNVVSNELDRRRVGPPRDERPGGSPPQGEPNPE